MKPYFQYAGDVIAGRVVCGRLITLAVERFYQFQERDDIVFREDRVDYVIRFISKLKHYTGRHAGKPFDLQSWQSFIIACIYGFYYVETGERVVKSVYIEMARKQGKSALAAALCLYHLIADGESGAEVYLAANSKDQVKLSSWPLCSNFAKGLDPKGEYLDIFRDMVKFDATKSWLKVLAADSTKLDGPNPSMFLLDEYHAAKSSGLKDVLQSGQGMRDDPMQVIITTAGFDKMGPCYQMRTMCVEILEGLKEDDSIFAAIYALDEADDWKDESVWAKSNPNLDVTVKLSYIRNQVKKATNSPSEEVGVRTKNINEWCDSAETWIPDDNILAVSRDVDLSMFGPDTECYAGIDLSATSDLAAVSYMIPHMGKMYFKTDYYLPQEALKTKKNKEQYGEWARLGHLKVTPGNVIDYDCILEDILQMDSKLFIMKIGYDSWNATQFVINAENRGLPMEPVSQSIGNFNRPTKEMERSILSAQVVIDNNPITRFCFRNVVMKVDYNGNTKPSKQFNDKKIDGVVAMIEAYGVYLLSPHYVEE